MCIKAHERRCTREKGIGLTHSVTEAKRFQAHAFDISFDVVGTANCHTTFVECSWKTGMTNVKKMGRWCSILSLAPRKNWNCA